VMCYHVFLNIEMPVVLRGIADFICTNPGGG
jgi:hypothetical protein